MLIDCDTCTMRNLACDDCVIRTLTAPDALNDPVGLTPEETRAVAVLARSGLVRPLRLVPRPAAAPAADGRRRGA